MDMIFSDQKHVSEAEVWGPSISLTFQLKVYCVMKSHIIFKMQCKINKYNEIKKNTFTKLHKTSFNIISNGESFGVIKICTQTKEMMI